MSDWLTTVMFGGPSKVGVVGCSGSETKAANTIKISGTSLEHAMEKSGVDICTTESDTYLSVVGKERAGADSLWVNLAKIVFEIPGLKEKFEALNDGQKKYVLERLGSRISENLQDQKASILKSWGPFHYFGCKTRLYGYKTPSQIDLKITKEAVINILKDPALLKIKGSGGGPCKPATLESYLNLYNPLALKAWEKSSFSIPTAGIFYAGNIDAPLPDNCKINVGSAESAAAKITKVPPAKSVKVETPVEAGAKETVIEPILLQVSAGGTFSISEKGFYTIKLACEKPAKFELELGTVEIKKKRGWKPTPKLPKCKDAYPPALQPAMRAAGKCR